MCVAPVRLPDGTQFRCRKCAQCKANYVNDWVGRCIAEGDVSSATSSVTLTYRETGLSSAILTYSDVQDYLRRLRNDGFPVRFVVAGEYGAKKGRAHWHAILFWRDRVPEHPLRQNFSQEHWPHGFSFWDNSSNDAIRYVCKYILKAGRDDQAQSLFRMSKRPSLGSAYFEQMALRYAVAGLAPQEPAYCFAGVPGPDGKPLRFWLHRHSADRFVMCYLRAWYSLHGRHPPQSTFIEDWCDNNVSKAHGAESEGRRLYKGPLRGPGGPVGLARPGAVPTPRLRGPSRDVSNQGGRERLPSRLVIPAPRSYEGRPEPRSSGRYWRDLVRS